MENLPIINLPKQPKKVKKIFDERIKEIEAISGINMDLLGPINEKIVPRIIDITHQLEKLKKVAEDNMKIVDNISNQLNALDESINNLWITNIDNISIEINDITLTIEYVGQKSRKNKRIICSMVCNGKLIKKPLAEFSIEARMKAFEHLPLLLEKVYENQISVKKFKDLKYYAEE